jgi:enoyl-CoA hydratase/carnithine racemase
MSEKVIVTHPSDGVVQIQLDNPPSNTLGSEARTRFLAALDELERDMSVRCVVLTGTGRNFCSGDDLREAGRRADGEAVGGLGAFGRILNRIEAFRTPVIAAINGHAAGGGLELALCCDIRLGVPDAKFIAAGVNVGLMASVYRLPRLIGIARAKMILLTGWPTDGKTALEYGLITQLCAPTALLPEALKLAQRIASRAPLSVEAAKRQVGRAFDMNPEEAAKASGEELSVLTKSNDHKIGIAAFVAREEPKFTRS